MNILQVGKVSKKLGGNAVGGVSKHVEDLSLYLVKNQHNVFIYDFSLKFSEAYSKGIGILGLDLTHRILVIFQSLQYLLKSGYTLRNKIKIAWSAVPIAQIVFSKKIDVIHFHSLHNPAIYFVRKIVPAGIPIITTDHGFWQNISFGRKKSLKRMVERSIDSSSKVIYISSFALSQLHLFFGAKSNYLFVPNPIDTSQIKVGIGDKRLNPLKKNIFFNGFSDSVTRKGLDVLLKAIDYSEKLKKECQLIIICNQMGRVEAAKYNGLIDITILGTLPWSDVIAINRKADLLVVPSKSESFGLVYLESLAVGTPVIGFNETVLEFEEKLNTSIGESYFPEKDDFKTLSKKIENVLEKKYDRAELCGLVEQNYSWEKEVQNFVKIYESCLNQT